MHEPAASRVHVLGVAAIGALAFVLLFAFVYGHSTVIPLAGEQGTVFPSRGFYDFERGPEVSFVWTKPNAELSLAGIDRRGSWRWTASAYSWRSTEAAPVVRVAVDGVTQLERTIEQAPEALEVVLPPRPGKRGATVTIETTPSFVPGPGDRRELGIALSNMSIAPTGRMPAPPRSATTFGALAVFALGLTLGAVGLRWPWLLALVFSAAVALVMLFMRGFAAHGRYPSHALALAAAVGIAAWLVVVVSDRVRTVRWSNAARGVVALSALACFLKLLVLLHPIATLGDGVFHAHRFETVLHGHLYFTSIAPGDYAFPYPVLLYLIAAPLSLLTGDTLERVALLRIVVTVADAFAGALLYWMIVRATSNRAAGVVAVFWYHVIPMTAWIMTWGNLTNAFGQTLFVASLAAVVALPVGRDRRSIVVLSILAAAALLSHPSTCAILTIVLALTSLLYWWQRDAPVKTASLGVLVATIAAGLSAFVLYYAWFPALYVHELGRVAAESGRHLASATPANPMSVRLAALPNLARTYLGWPALMAAVIGGWRIYEDARSPRLAWLLVGWVGACVAFQLIGVVTPMQLRTHFALFPALAIAAAFGSVWAWRGSWLLRGGVVVLTGWALWLGVQQWAGLLG